MSYPSEVLSEPPYLYWRLGEPSGTTAEDATANNRDGTYTNTPTLGVTGALTGDADTAVTFDAAQSELVERLDSVNLTNNFAVECWAKLPSLTSQLGLFAYNGDSNIDGWGFGVGDGAGGTGVKLTGLLGGVAWLDSGYTFADTGWHHVVMTREAGTTKFYVDGAQTANTSVSVPVAPSTFIRAAGARQGGVEARFFTGSLDEVAFYAGALSAARVLAHFAASVPATPVYRSLVPVPFM